MVLNFNKLAAEIIRSFDAARKDMDTVDPADEFILDVFRKIREKEGKEGDIINDAGYLIIERANERLDQFRRDYVSGLLPKYITKGIAVDIVKRIKNYSTDFVCLMTDGENEYTKKEAESLKMAIVGAVSYWHGVLAGVTVHNNSAEYFSKHDPFVELDEMTEKLSRIKAGSYAGVKKRRPKMAELKEYALNKYHARKWPSPRNAATVLRDDIVRHGHEIGAGFSEDGIFNTIYTWFLDDKKLRI
ncbi:hypothetical protein AGMMS49543_24340 [Betaproteobacteria bacterium]|nr:hypothetical protein AGMMS49543_24340 [Betaproteobacteria bacterium]GHU23559.1 hypothetical protein AGMMS50243_25190 [Betaproteobacteria bacterium]